MTSFPHYVKRFTDLGVKAFYVPLAFDEDAISRYWVSPDGIRWNDCAFIGGVGNPSHWRQGMATLEAVAKYTPSFKWWGYGVETLPADSVLRSKYQGQAWGHAAFDIMQKSKIVLNRHGEVSAGYANNMRMFEATGCGAMLLTDDKSNMQDFFTEDECVTYRSPMEAVGLIKYFLSHEDERAKIAKAGQARTLRDHTYQKRMKEVAEVLKANL